jgi:hypothetical protein
VEKWTHNSTGRDYFELGRGPYSSENTRVNDYDFVVGVDAPGEPLKIFPQMNFNKDEHRGATFYFGQMQTADPVEFGHELVGYRSDVDNKIWFRPTAEFEHRFTNILRDGGLK